MKVLRHQPRTDLATVGFTGHERSSSLADAMGWILVVAALRFDTRKLRALAALILNVPNTLLAGIFSLAAVMGD